MFLTSKNDWHNTELDEIQDACSCILDGRPLSSMDQLLLGMTHLMAGEAELGLDGNSYLCVVSPAHITYMYDMFLDVLIQHHVPHSVDRDRGIVRTWARREINIYNHLVYTPISPWQIGHSFWFIDFQYVHTLIRPSYKFSSTFIALEDHWKPLAAPVYDIISKTTPPDFIYKG